MLLVKYRFTQFSMNTNWSLPIPNCLLIGFDKKIVYSQILKERNLFLLETFKETGSESVKNLENLYFVSYVICNLAKK